MNERTLVAICGYSGDAKLAHMMRHVHEAHKCPIVMLSPTDFPVTSYGPHLCQQAGKRAYIGQLSLDRQVEFFKICLAHEGFDFFLMNDADSCVLSAELPKPWYNSDVLWTNVVADPRTHPTRLPRLAFQPPYFLSRRVMQEFVKAAPRCPANHITPYVDHFFLQLVCETGVGYRHHGELEASSPVPQPPGDNPFIHTEYRVRHGGCVTQHPIKTFALLKLVEKARKDYESR